MSARDTGLPLATLGTVMKTLNIVPHENRAVRRCMEDARLHIRHLPRVQRFIIRNSNGQLAIFGAVPLFFLMANSGHKTSQLVDMAMLFYIAVGAGLFLHRLLYATDAWGWDTMRLDAYSATLPSDPVPESTMEKVHKINSMLPDAVFWVHYLKKDPWLKVYYGNEEYWIDGWEGDKLLM